MLREVLFYFYYLFFNKDNQMNCLREHARQRFPFSHLYLYTYRFLCLALLASDYGQY